MHVCNAMECILFLLCASVCSERVNKWNVFKVPERSKHWKKKKKKKWLAVCCCGCPKLGEREDRGERDGRPSQNGRSRCKIRCQLNTGAVRTASELSFVQTLLIGEY